MAAMGSQSGVRGVQDVRGALGAVCRVCRALGLCPLPLAPLAPPDPRGFAARALSIYSFCIMLPLYNVIGSMGLRELYLSPSKNMYKYVSRLTCFVCFVLLTDAALLTGPRRMRSWSQCLSLLEQITSRNKNIEKKERKWVIFICLYVGLVFIINISYIFVYGCTADKFCSLPNTLYMALMQGTLTLTTYAISFQYILMVARIYSAIKKVNITLKNVQLDGLKFSTVKWRKVIRNNFLNVTTVLSQVRTDHIEYTKTSAKVREQALAFMSICDIIRKITASDAAINVLIILVTITRLMLSTHVLVEMDQDENFNWILISCVELMWGLNVTVRTILMIEPCHRTQHQLRMAKVLVNVSIREWYSDVEVANELKLFNYLCCLNDPTFSPFGICTMDRSLNTRILGFVTTFFVALTQNRFANK